MMTIRWAVLGMPEVTGGGFRVCAMGYRGLSFQRSLSTFGIRHLGCSQFGNPSVSPLLKLGDPCLIFGSPTQCGYLICSRRQFRVIFSTDSFMNWVHYPTGRAHPMQKIITTHLTLYNRKKIVRTAGNTDPLCKRKTTLLAGASFLKVFSSTVRAKHLYIPPLIPNPSG